MSDNQEEFFGIDCDGCGKPARFNRQDYTLSMAESELIHRHFWIKKLSLESARPSTWLCDDCNGYRAAKSHAARMEAVPLDSSFLGRLLAGSQLAGSSPAKTPKICSYCTRVIKDEKFMYESDPGLFFCNLGGCFRHYRQMTNSYSPWVEEQERRKEEFYKGKVQPNSSAEGSDAPTSSLRITRMKSSDLVAGEPKMPEIYEQALIDKVKAILKTDSDSDILAAIREAGREVAQTIREASSYNWSIPIVECPELPPGSGPLLLDLSEIVDDRSFQEKLDAANLATNSYAQLPRGIPFHATLDESGAHTSSNCPYCGIALEKHSVPPDSKTCFYIVPGVKESDVAVGDTVHLRESRSRPGPRGLDHQTGTKKQIEPCSNCGEPNDEGDLCFACDSKLWPIVEAIGGKATPMVIETSDMSATWTCPHHPPGLEYKNTGDKCEVCGRAR